VPFILAIFQLSAYGKRLLVIVDRLVILAPVTINVAQVVQGGPFCLVIF
jgi:hypothetical protein